MDSKINNYILKPTKENFRKLGDIRILTNEQKERICKVNGNFFTKGVSYFLVDRGLEAIYYLEKYIEKNNDIEAIGQLLIFSLRIKYYKKFNEYISLFNKYACNKDMTAMKLLVSMSLGECENIKKYMGKLQLKKKLKPYEKMIIEQAEKTMTKLEGLKLDI